jgi:hypothetical protein
MRRRQLLQTLPAVLLAIPVLGCFGGDDYPLRPNGNSAGNGGGTEGRGSGGGGASSFVAHNQDDSGHLHDLLLACSEMDDGVTTYIATGPHEHRVELTDADLSDILAGQSVSVITTGGGHMHTWRIQMPDGRC